MISGEYNRVFGVTRLDEDYSNIGNITDEMSAAYLHESIHFIQDFGSVYGVNMAVFRLSHYLDMIREINNGKFRGYLTLSSEGDFVKSCFDCMQGDSFQEEKVAICHIFNGIEICDEYSEFYKDEFPNQEENFKQGVLIKYDNEKSFVFGGDAISESMAYLFEQYFYASKDYENCFPYAACELLFEHVIGEKCENIPVMIAMCYASLQNPWPGITFYELLLEIKSKGVIPEKMEQVFEMAKCQMKRVSEDQMKNLYERIDGVLPLEGDEVTKHQIVKKFVDDMAYCNEWLKNHYRYITEHENELREALIYVLETVEEKKKIAAMRILLDEYGHPIIVDKKGKLYDKNDNKLVFLLAPYALQEIILNNNERCALIEVCKGNGKKISDACMKNCWKVYIPNTICILRFYLYIMGLGATQFEELEDSVFSR